VGPAALEQSTTWHGVANPTLSSTSTLVIVPTLVPWYGWHAFRRGLASNLYEMGAPDKVVQRVLRHSKPHVTKERYIKVFDRTVLEAVQKIQARIE
jgi:integrase